MEVGEAEAIFIVELKDVIEIELVLEEAPAPTPTMEDSGVADVSEKEEKLVAVPELSVSDTLPRVLAGEDGDVDVSPALW